MSRHHRSLIPAGLILGGIAWLTIPIFLPLLMMGESSGSKSNHALFFVLSGPALILPWTILGRWHPRVSSLLFLFSALVNMAVIILWAQPQGDYVPMRDMDDLFGLFVTLVLPGPLLLLVFAFFQLREAS